MNDLTSTRYRDAALQQARVAYKAEHGCWPSRSWKLEALQAPSVQGAAPQPYISPERAAWNRAYNGAEVLPAVRWEPSGATIRPTWLLQTYSPARARYSHS